MAPLVGRRDANSISHMQRCKCGKGAVPVSRDVMGQL